MNFNHLLQLILYTTQGNQLLSGSSTNAKFQYNISSTTEENMIDILWIYSNDQSCSCGLSSNSCAVLYNDYCNNTFIPYSYTSPSGSSCYNSIPGLILSCYVVDGLLTSKSECFYDLECVGTM